MKQLTVKDQHSLIAALHWIQEQDEYEWPIDITIKPHEYSLSADQRRLYWTWITAIAKKIGNSKDEQHLYCKERYLVPIFIRDDPEYAEMWETVRQVWRQGMKNEAESMKKKIVQLTSIIHTNIKQMAEYLTEIDLEYSRQGIYLPRKDDSRDLLEAK